VQTPKLNNPDRTPVNLDWRARRAWRKSRYRQTELQELHCNLFGFEGRFIRIHRAI